MISKYIIKKLKLPQPLLREKFASQHPIIRVSLFPKYHHQFQRNSPGVAYKLQYLIGLGVIIYAIISLVCTLHSMKATSKFLPLAFSVLHLPLH